ncbi:MAG: Eco57I restriction-modification methylase domain-containing protein [Pseudomonadota bacterium]
MSAQANFTLRGRNPDVLTCIANLSNDEVFTPPEFANRMLDTLAEAWAASHGGANLWADKTVKFLDPCTKSGVFLREITSRLTKGLEKEIPELKKRVNHILTQQVFGIGITQITSLLARRSVYCSKHAKGEHSIAKSFASDDGNIWFKRIEHTWNGDRCEYCGAGKSVFDRAPGLETHAYAFIHTDNVKARLAEIFGGNMQFDVIIGNPPYQMDDGGVGGAMPLYQKFVQSAKALQPRFLSMVTPSRWFAGGRGLDKYREEMLGDKHLRVLVDWPKADEVFPGVLIGGGVSYFLWDSNYNGQCLVTVVRNGEESQSLRDLNQHDIFIRSNEALPILEKVLEKSSGEYFSSLMSGPDPFGFRSNFEGYHDKPQRGDLLLHYNAGGRGAVRAIGYVSKEEVTRNCQMVGKWKLMLNRVYNVAEKYPHRIIGAPALLPPNEICTGSFLVAGPFSTKAEAESAKSYYETKFFRFLLHLRKINQDAARHSYQWVPVQAWDRQWTDRDLYKKYKLTKGEIDYIELVIRPIDINGDSEDE